MKKLILLFCILPFLLFSQIYEPDVAFGNNGMVVTSFNVNEYDSTTSYSYVKLNDNKTLVLARISIAGDVSYAIIKYLESGELDIDFGNNGVLNIPQGETISLSKIYLFDNQKILLSNYNNLYMLRLLPNGNVDNLFGNNGVVNNIGGKIILHSNKIISCKNIVINDINYLETSRYLENGNIDISFGENGFVTTQIDANSNSIKNIIIKDNNIFVHLKTYNNSQNSSYVVSYDFDGTLNTNFGTNGILNYDTSIGYQNNAFNVKNNGKLIFAIPNENSYYLTQYLANGTLDMSFGSNGIAINDLDYSTNNFGHYLNKIICKADNTFIVMMGLGGFEDSSLVLTGFEENGYLDTNFSFNQSLSYQYTDVVMQNDEKILILGETYWYSQNQKIVLDRFTKSTLSVNDANQKFIIYPNPVNNYLTIKHNSSNNTPFKIVDLLGKEILKGVLIDFNTIVDLSALKGGIFFIKIKDSTYKLVKK